MTLGAVFLLVSVCLLTTISSVYSSNLEKNYINQVVAASEQALSNYAKYTEDVVNISDAIQKKLDNEDENTVASVAGPFFNDIRLVSNGIDSVSLYSENGVLLACDSLYTETSTPENIMNSSWFTSAVESPLVNSFSIVDSKSQFTLSKVLSLKAGSSNAILKIQYDFTSIASVIDEAKLGTDGHAHIFDNFYNTVYSSNDISEEEMKVIQNQVIGTSKYSDSNHDFFMYISTIPYTRWRVAIVTNIDTLSSTKRDVILIASLITIVSIFIIVFLIYTISNHLTRPLVRLQREMAAVVNLDFKIKNSNKIVGTREVVALNKSFSAMMNRIHVLAQEVVNEQKAQNKAELKALQNQINPHFLYNTLDSIIYLIDEGRNEDAQNMIVALSRFFRISISRGKNIIPAHDELEHVRYYMQIQKMRFGDSFSYSIDASSDVNDYYVIKLILQPIVENAIVHGLGEKPNKNSNITIKAYTDHKFLRFDITDNGFGMLPEKIEDIYKTFKNDNIHNGVGIKNVYQRLRIFYGDEADIKIESKLDEGTKISIYIPKKEALKNEEN